jgi:two-component sensor histidine kinase
MERCEELFTRIVLRIGPGARFGLAVLAPALALAVKLALGPALPGFAFITFYPAVVLAAALGGLWPGLLSLALSAAAAWFPVLPETPFSGATPSWSGLAIGLFVLVGLPICVLLHWLRHGMVRRTEERAAAVAAREEAEAARSHATALLLELEHRVRNNLQLMSSMLALQARSAASREARGALEDAAGRVRALGHVQQALVEEINPAEVSLDRFLGRLGPALTEHTGLNCKIDAAALSMPARRAVPLALIVNELVSNAVKYAYRDGVGPLLIRCAAAPGGGLRLTVADHGVGLPEGVDPKTGKGLGLTIIRALAAQLRAEIELERRGGTAITLVIPPSEDQPAGVSMARSAER